MTKPEPKLPSPMGQAALEYARRGWPVFPCRECDGEPYRDRKDELVTPKAKAPYIKSGVSKVAGQGKASRDETQILAWWRSWPNALIGVPMGENGLFALDFDPRTEEVVDQVTGEITTVEWTLEQMKAEVEAQIGCELPVSLAVRTPSGGVHVYYRQPEDGAEALRNRNNLPRHVDVRGQGGYVIAPPSIIVEPCVDATPGKYRFLRGDRHAAAVAPPAALVEALRAPKGAAKAPAGADRPSAPARPLPPDLGETEREAIRKYALSALDGECQAVRSAGSGQRNDQLNVSALKIASLVAAGAVQETFARQCIEAAARENPGRDDDAQLQKTIESGWSAGINNPRDLGEIAAAARDRAERGGRSRPQSSRPRSPSPAPPNDEANGAPSSRMGESGEDRGKKGFGGEDEAGLARKCAFMPQTDLGNLERFLARHGRDFLYVEAWGWLAWDGRRWNRDMAMALLGYAVQRTMRAIQEEADFIRESGQPVDELPLWDAEQKRANEAQNRRRFDRVVKKSRGEITLFSDQLAKWGRTSEGAGHINCIAKLAEARLSAMPADFDSDPLLLNMQSGTLVFLRPETGFKASVREREHRREDRITKIGNARYDPKATCPKFDAFLETVQPTEDMRDFLDTWAGYSSLGLADAQKMAVFYGEGSNGKGVWVNVTAHILGDYSWSTGIETFIDAGRTRKGADASPDLAALAGRRMVYANEPEDNSKFADGLIKSLTSDEPKGGVRELMKAPFELQITFNNTVMANNIPRISTDHGIQRRVQIVPWGVIIPDEEQDLLLKAKLKAEADGILNRMVRGALRYLSEGLAIPEAVKEATREYQAENDLLGGFLGLCVARVKGETVGATPLHRLFVAWQTWAGQLPQSGKPWSAKYLNAQMRRKSFKIAKSSTMQWQDVALRFDEIDFVTIDEKGVMRPVEHELPAPRTFEAEDVAKGAPAPPHPPDDDDIDVPF